MACIAREEHLLLMRLWCKLLWYLIFKSWRGWDVSTAGAAAGFVQWQGGVQRAVHFWVTSTTGHWSVGMQLELGVAHWAETPKSPWVVALVQQKDGLTLRLQTPNGKSFCLWGKHCCDTNLLVLKKFCAVNHDELMSSCGLHVAATLASGILALNIWHLFPLCSCLSSCVWDIKVTWTRPLLCFVLWLVCQKQSLCEVFAESPASLYVWCGDFEPAALVLLG